MHELSLDSGNFELLGLSFSDTGLFGPKGWRQWKLWQALRELLRIGHASSRDISVVVGHFTSPWLDESFSVSVVGTHVESHMCAYGARPRARVLTFGGHMRLRDTNRWGVFVTGETRVALSVAANTFLKIL